MSSQVSTLHLKWRFFRDLLQMPQSDREIATAYWGPDEGPSKFSKMLKGDLGFPPDAADMLATIINKRIGVRNGIRAGEAAMRGGDLYLPLFEFASKLVEVCGILDQDSLQRAHRGLLDALVPSRSADGGQLKLTVQRVAKDRAFEGFLGADEGPTVFEVG
jgi:hypothetical protein